MKKILSLALASAMALSIAATAMAAEASYKIGAIEGTAYGYDKDLAAVDLRDANPDFTYGDTLYYPLLSAQGVGSQTAVNEAKQALEDAKAAKGLADQALANAEADASAKAAALAAAEQAESKAQELLDAANAWKAIADAAGDETEAKAAFTALAAEYSITVATAADAVNDATEAVATASADVAAKTSDKNVADAAVVTEQGKVAAAALLVTEKQDAVAAALAGNFKYVYESEAVKSIKIKQNWDMNGKLVSNVDIVKKKAVASTELEQKFIYFVAVTLKDSTSTSASDINGKIQLRKSGEFDYADMSLEVALAVGFAEANDGVITSTPKIFSEGNGFSGDVEDELRFDVAPDSYFTVNTNGQGKLLIAMDSRFDSEIAARFPEANLDFLNGNGATFNKTGIMSIYAPEGSYIYKVNADGSLSAIKAEYDEYEETYNFKTRTIDRYVIADAALKNTGAPVGGGNTDTDNGTNNPSTGAAL